MLVYLASCLDSSIFPRTTIPRTVPGKTPTSRARARRMVLSPTNLARQENDQALWESARLGFPNAQM
jgi:hypothetical protein